MLDATGIATTAAFGTALKLQHERPVRGESYFIFAGIDH
jgi:hypothetical protein